MFKSALFKLTAIYLLVIMAISLFFSAGIYQLASRELSRGYRSQVGVIEDDPFEVPVVLRQRLKDSRLALIDEARSSLLTSLAMTNLAILVLGGGLSYFLARRSLEPIEESHKALERFTADASHELRTPLAAMKSEIEVALMQKKLSSKEAQDVLKSNLEEVDSLTRLSDNLLNLARLEELDLNISKINAQKLVDQSIRKVEEQAKDKSIKISVKSVDKKIQLEADTDLCEQVLIILLDNAIKYSSKKSEVIVNIEQNRSNVNIEISDSGAGISKEEQQHIFERFYRADSSRNKSTKNGHGLGLAIAKQLAEKQGGSITVKSTVGKGSAFTLVLPKA